MNKNLDEIKFKPETKVFEIDGENYVVSILSGAFYGKAYFEDGKLKRWKTYYGKGDFKYETLVSGDTKNELDNMLWDYLEEKYTKD